MGKGDGREGSVRWNFERTRAQRMEAGDSARIVGKRVGQIGRQRRQREGIPAGSTNKTPEPGGLRLRHATQAFFERAAGGKQQKRKRMTTYRRGSWRTEGCLG